jgi:hypothetical protein
MPFNIRDFKARGLPRGGARPSLFQVKIKSPFASANEERITFTCRAASLPPAVIGSVSVPYFGRSIKLSGDREFPAWDVMVMNDEDFGGRALFERWSNSMNRIVDNIREATSDNEGYKQDAVVEQFGKSGQVIRSYKMVGLFPTVVGQIELDWEATNQVEVFSTSFDYDYWIPVEQGASDTYETGEAGN